MEKLASPKLVEIGVFLEFKDAETRRMQAYKVQPVNSRTPAFSDSPAHYFSNL